MVINSHVGRSYRRRRDEARPRQRTGGSKKHNRMPGFVVEDTILRNVSQARLAH